MVAIKETVALGDLEMHDSENGIELGQGSRRGVQTHSDHQHYYIRADGRDEGKEYDCR